MKLGERLQKAWENRNQIIDGLYHTYITCKPELEQEAQRRLTICRANTCGMWDETGTSEKLVVKGYPGCTACGCKGDIKVHCFQCHCTLKDMGQEPLWDAVMTQEQANEINATEYRKQFENKK